MLFAVHDEAVVNLIREDDELVLSRNLYNLFEEFLRIKGACRIVRIDYDDSFRLVGYLFLYVLKVRIPVGLFITDIMYRLAACQIGTGRPERVIGLGEENFIACVQKRV